MARIRGTRNASTELAMLRLLRASGVSGWRRQMALPGRPDFAWPRRHLALFVDGCFWHGHASCGKNVTPSANAPLWRAKIIRNRRRDARVSRHLRRDGWSVLRVWECALNRRPEACLTRVTRALRGRS